MSREIHLHIQLKHLLVMLTLILLVVVGSATVLASSKDNPVTQALFDSFRPAGQIRIARAASTTSITCGYFGNSPCQEPALAVSFNVPSGQHADIVATFTAEADTSGVCSVIPELDNNVTSFPTDPLIFAIHSSFGQANTLQWNLANVPAGNHTLSVHYFESVATSGSCELDGRYLTLLANLHS